MKITINKQINKGKAKRQTAKNKPVECTNMKKRFELFLVRKNMERIKVPKALK